MKKSVRLFEIEEGGRVFGEENFGGGGGLLEMMLSVSLIG